MEKEINTQEENMQEGSTFSSKLNMFRVGVSVLVVLLVVGGLVYSTRHISENKKNILDNNRLLESVSKLMIVPNENPIIATINKADVLLKEQAFYAGAQNGDKLLIFPQAQKAVIYSISRNLIVNVGPFVVNPNTDKQVPSVPTEKK